MAMLSSCVKDMDIDSLEDSGALPIVDTELVTSNFDLTAMNASESRIITDTVTLNIGTPEFSKQQLSQANLTFKFLNSSPHYFNVDFEFLNDSDELRHQVNVSVSPGTSDNPSSIETLILIEEPEILNFRECKKLIYKIKLPQDKELSSSENMGSLILTSKANFFFE